MSIGDKRSQSQGHKIGLSKENKKISPIKEDKSGWSKRGKSGFSIGDE